MKKYIRAWAYLFNGPSIVQHGFHQVRPCYSYFNRVKQDSQVFQQSHGKPFEIQSPDTRMVFVSSPKHIKELDSTSDTILSLNGAAKHVYNPSTPTYLRVLSPLLTLVSRNQMLQPLYTMNGFNWFDQRGAEGVGFVRTLRTLLTNNLPRLLPDLRVLTTTRWSRSLSDRATVSGAFVATALVP